VTAGGPVPNERGKSVALSRRTAGALTAATAVVASLVLAGSAFGADQRLVKGQDDCDPVTFNAAGIPCIGDGRTTIQDLIAGAQAGVAVDKWQFSRPDFNIDAGGTITVVDEGGEPHTFTRVAFFGNGCSPLDNGKPVAGGIDCATFDPFADTSTVFPGGPPLTVGGLEPGTVRFQCMIHPWMRATVDVRARGNRGGRG
jgi:plastocyanin